MLDDAQIKKEANANAFGVKIKNPTFPEGTFAEDKDEDGNVIDAVAYEDLRWHNFVHFSTEKMYHIVKDFVFKFIREMHNGENNAFSRFMTDAKLDIPSGKILEKVTLFDVYKGRQIADGKKSISYSIVMRSHDGTLNDEQADNAMKKVLKDILILFSYPDTTILEVSQAQRNT